MSEKKKDFLVNLVFGAMIAAAVFALNMSREYGFLRSLCDGAFVAAALLLGIGGLKGIRNKGAFDVTGYGLKSAVETAIPFLRHGEKETMDEYRERKAKERRDSRGMLLAGVVYLVLALLSLILFHLI